MALSPFKLGSVLLLVFVFLAFMPSPAAAFGAGNIPSIAQVEGVNWRHGGTSSLNPTGRLFVQSLSLC